MLKTILSTKKSRHSLNSLIILLITFLLPSFIFPGTTGKISGIITDAYTGDPVPGCNIIIEGTTMGAASDVNGEYFILNIPPGNYTIRASMIGYKTYRVDQVQVMSDLTTKIDVTMEETSLQMDEEVVVVAERPLVQKDETKIR